MTIIPVILSGGSGMRLWPLSRKQYPNLQRLFFFIGGRTGKDEIIDSAMNRIAKDELNIELKATTKFIGVFEHFYDDSIYENISTHYVNLAYEYQVEEIIGLPTEQHSEYKWFIIGELLESNQVHNYTKD